MLKINTVAQRHHVWITLLFVYTILTSAILVQGSFQTTDTVYTVFWGDLLKSYQFNYFRFYTGGGLSGTIDASGKMDFSCVVGIGSVFNFGCTPFFFTLPVTVIAILKSITNDQLIIGHQIVNLVALFFTLFLYIKIAFHLGIRKWVISASLLIFLISIDFMFWPRHFGNGMNLFVLVLMLAVYAITTQTNHYLSRIFTITSLILVLITRPSPHYVAVLSFFVFFPSLSQIILAKKTLMVRLGIFTLILSVFYSIIVMANVSDIISPKGLPESYFREFLITHVEEGVVVHERPEYSIAYEATYLGTVKLYLYRMVGFFTPFAKDFSLIHNTLNGLLLLGCYVVVLVMFRYSFSDFEQNNTRARAITLLLTLIVSVAAFHSVVLIDYDWRYRYPIIAPLILLTTLIFDNFLKTREIKINYGVRNPDQPPRT